MAGKKGSDKPVVIKKYANRRLYDTGRSSYVTLDDLCEMIKDGYEFVVYDAKSGDDLTRQVLTQIIVEQESKGETNLLPVNFLRQLIGFYGNGVSPLVPNFLEQTFGMFTKNQEQMKEQMSKSLGPLGQQMGQIVPLQAFEEIAKQNMAMFENAMKAFGNFVANFPVGGKPTAQPEPPPEDEEDK
ncbi:MAG: polyhydroxyalkanoate synthesis repressor PhaR [Micavibrio aeruginosavorus]|uniref:Polyhydroxyalkanoate synthesis repressor PhaR n=1 Tax=Micavibrio aeruginosavorus TaxID=349221 RepID=A0A2W5FL92_9BACT|nr:MAG: polyhydroxyalkanoate synthesis repressor PhaR [Micavibrio aeruginosavorus]